MPKVLSRCRICTFFLCCENPTLVNKVDMFHSETSDEKKSDIIKKLQDGDREIKVVIAILPLEWV